VTAVTATGDAAPQIAGLYVSSDIDSHGIYTPTLHIGEDRSRSFTYSEAVAYGNAVVMRACQAAHIHSVFKLLTADDAMPADTARAIIAEDLFPRLALGENPDRMHHATRPLEFVPALARERGTESGMGVVRIDMDGKMIGYYRPQEAREHGMFVLESATMSQGDNATYDSLRDLQADEPKARGFVSALADHYPVGFTTSHPDGP
jgi:hypothetical protein